MGLFHTADALYQDSPIMLTGPGETARFRHCGGHSGHCMGAFSRVECPQQQSHGGCGKVEETASVTSGIADSSRSVLRAAMRHVAPTCLARQQRPPRESCICRWATESTSEDVCCSGEALVPAALLNVSITDTCIGCSCPALPRAVHCPHPHHLLSAVSPPRGHAPSPSAGCFIRPDSAPPGSLCSRQRTRPQPAIAQVCAGWPCPALALDPQALAEPRGQFSCCQPIFGFIL